MRASLFLLLLVCASPCCRASDPSLVSVDPNRPIFLVVAGQSNAAGFGVGATPDNVPAHLRPAFPNVFLYRNVAPAPAAPSFGYAPYQTGVNSVPEAVPGGSNAIWGPEAEFCYQVEQEFPGRKVYLSKSTLGGSQLANSDLYGHGAGPTADWAPTSSGELFDGAMGGARNALAAAVTDAGLPASAFDCVVLWMQGEADADLSPRTAADYGLNLTAFISALRGGPKNWGLGSNVPFVLGRITVPSWPYNGPVRLAEGTVAAADRSRTRLVDTDRFELAGDQEHYSNNGQVSLGAAMYQSVRGTYPAASVVLSDTTFTLAEQPANGTSIGSVNGVGTPLPTPVYAFVSGETAGLTVDPNSGLISVVDGTLLRYADDASRTLVIEASNGVNTTTANVTINLTPLPPPTDVANTLVRFDPNDAAHTALNADGTVQSLLDTRGNGFSLYAGQLGQGTGATPAPFPGTLERGIFVNGNQSLDSNNGGTVCSDADQNFTFMAVVHPVAGPCANEGTILGISEGAVAGYFGLVYDYGKQAFGVHVLNGSNEEFFVNEAGTTPSPINQNYRVRLHKHGSLLELFVNGQPRPLAATGNTAKVAILHPGATGGANLGTQALFYQAEYSGYVGLGRFVRGDPSQLENALMEQEMLAWVGGAAASAPVITSPATADLTVGQPFSYQITATNSPTRFGASGLPPGLSVDTAGGLISGTPTTGGTGPLTLSAGNAAGTGSATLTLTTPFADYLASFGLTGTNATADSDGDGISNLLEFVLGGNPTIPDASILPAASYATINNTGYLVYTFHSVAQPGSVTWTVESSNDLTTWSTVVDGTSGVTIKTTSYNARYNLTVVQLPTGPTGRRFARLHATLPSN